MPEMFKEASGFVFFNFPHYQQLGFCGGGRSPVWMSPLPRGFATMVTAVCVCVRVCGGGEAGQASSEQPDKALWCQVPKGPRWLRLDDVRLRKCPPWKLVGGGFGLSAPGLQPNGMHWIFSPRDIPSWVGVAGVASCMDPKALGHHGLCPPWAFPYTPVH